MNLIFFTTQDRFFLSHIKDRADYFAGKGYKVYVLAEKTENKYVESIEALNFKFYNTNIRRDAVNPIMAVGHLFRIWSIYREIRPDIVIHLGAKSIFLGTIAAKFQTNLVSIINAPIGLGHIFVSNTFKTRLLRRLVVFLYRILLSPKKARVIVENQDDINFFLKIGAVKKEHVYLVPGAGVDTEKFIPRNSSLKNDSCHVIMVARLTREKGVYEFILAAETIFREKLPIKCQIAGKLDPNNPSSLTQEEFERLKRNPAVEYLGYSDDVISMLQQADIACLPSYREGLPRSLIEACSCGLPIITTDTVGCREIINNENGILVPVADEVALFQAIKTLSLSQEMRRSMGKKSRELAIRRFDKIKISEQTYKISQEVYEAKW